jgi:hypothetical protein
MKKILLFMLLALGFWTFELTHAANFPDIKSPVLLEAVEYLNEKGIIKGYPDGTFKPDQVINRAEALKIIFESRGIAVEEYSNSGFPDVDASLWFAKYVTSAKKLGLIQGYADGTYKPTQFVNKAEFMKISMLAQSYYSQPDNNQMVLNQFSDLDSSAWYIPFLGFALSNEFVDRVDRFNPTGGMTRGEAALIIYRVAKYNESLVVEPLPYLSCETCVNGVDLSQYEWSTSPVVKIESGKIWVGSLNLTAEIIRDGNTGRLTNQSEINFQGDVKDAEFRQELEDASIEEKRNINITYPEYYERILGINGGAQVFDMYKSGGGYSIKNKDGKILGECECQFELNVLQAYNSHDYPPFEEWRISNSGKEILYEVIRIDLYNQ